jgi:hypothetical protein
MKPEIAILGRYDIWKIVATKLTQISGETVRSISNLVKVGNVYFNRFNISNLINY